MIADDLRDIVYDGYCALPDEAELLDPDEWGCEGVTLGDFTVRIGADYAADGYEIDAVTWCYYTADDGYGAEAFGDGGTPASDTHAVRVAIAQLGVWARGRRTGEPADADPDDWQAQQTAYDGRAYGA